MRQSWASDLATAPVEKAQIWIPVAPAMDRKFSFISEMISPLLSSYPYMSTLLTQRPYQAHEEVAVDLTVVLLYLLLNLSLAQNWLLPVNLLILQEEAILS